MDDEDRLSMPQRWQQVQSLRQQHTQAEVARIMGVSQARIHQIERSIARKRLLSAKRKNAQ